MVNGIYQLTALNDATTFSKLLEISSQASVKGTKTVVGMDFTISGSDAAQVIIPCLGPSLPISGGLSDPVLQLLDHTGAVIATNDSWKSSQQAEIEATGFAPASDLDAAVVTELQPGTYTAVLSGKTKKSNGLGLVDVHDLDPDLNSRLAILSTVGSVGKANAALMGDFTIGNGTAKTKVLLRALGVKLKDTTLELANAADGSTIVINDNWQDMQKTDIEATGLAPANNNDSAIVANLNPGSYRAIVRGKKNKTGDARLEVYSLP